MANKTENLNTLQIHKLTQAQYDQALKDNKIVDTAIYLTPDEDDFATQEEFDAKVAEIKGNISDINDALDSKVSKDITINGQSLTNNINLTYADVGAEKAGHNHDSSYATKDHSHDDYALSDVLDSHTSNTNLHFSADERTKLTGIETGAQVNTVLGVKGDSESTYRTGNINITKANIGLGNVDNTSDVNKPVSTAQQAAIDSALESAKTYADNKTSSLASTASVTSAISTHNASTDAHNDIRSLITGLTNRLNAVANSEDVNLDQLAEIVAYIKENKSLIDSVTTSKVNVADIINNLTTNVTNKPLSAAQGVEIKRLIDALQSSLQSSLDAHDTNTTKHITSTERTNWNAAKTLAENAVKKTGDTMSGNLVIGMNTDTAPQITLDAQPNATSGKRASALFRKYAFANSDYGTIIEDKTFNGSYTQLGLNTTATTPAEKIVLKSRTYNDDGSSSSKTYKLYGEHNKPTPSDIGLTATATELNHLDGVTSNVQAQIDSKLDADAITGGASTIVSDNLTTNRVLVSNNYGKVSASSITGGELGYLDGATRNIQTQINELQDTVSKKVDIYGDTMTGSLTIEPNTTYYPRVRLVGNANTSGQKAESSFDKVTGSTSDQGTNIVDTTFDGRETTLILQSNSTYDEQKLRLRIADADGNYEDYHIYGEHNKPTIEELGALGNSGTDLYYFINDRNTMSASNIVGDDVMPFIDVSLRSGRKITVNELLKYISNNSTLASVATVTAAEYTALEEAEATNANTLYMITDADDEEQYVEQVQFDELADTVSKKAAVQFITWEEGDTWENYDSGEVTN